MKRVIFVSLLVWAIGCETTDVPPPQVAVDINPAILDPFQYNPDASAQRFDLQVRNVGGGTLELDAIRYKGDPRCAFDFAGPDKEALGPGEATFIRVWYQPPGTGDDAMMLEIESNSETEYDLEVPICGRAMSTEPTEDDRLEECNPLPSNAENCPDGQDLL